MNRAYIVDSNYLKKNYPGYVESNIDNNSIESFILLAQDINTQSTIGYTMYNYIITQLIADPTGNTLSAAYREILSDWIMPEVSLWAIYQMFPTLLFHPTNKAIVKKKTNESDPVGMRELEYLRDQVRNNAEFYDSRIVEYIKNNVNEFPEYFSTSGVNRIRPKSNVYYGGIYLKDGPGRGRSGRGCCDDPGVKLNF